MVINDDFKNILIQKINDIINLNHHDWNNLNAKIKLKYVHRMCNYLENDNNEEIQNNITIPLKSIKPKKLIQFCGFSNQCNKDLYTQFNKLMLNYTFEFRKKYINIPKRTYYTYNNLPRDEYNLILNEINEIMFYFINKNKIDINKLLKSFIGSNYDKLTVNINDILDDKNNYNINYCDNNIVIIVDELKIILTLNFTSNLITKNIPVMYHIKLINNI
jgi:hypothetical protein